MNVLLIFCHNLRKSCQNVAECLLNVDEFFRNFAKMQFRLWRLITYAIPGDTAAIPGDSAAIPDV